MKVYIAAKFELAPEVAEMAKELRLLGIECTSRWVTEEGPYVKDDPAEGDRLARMDLSDVDVADIFVLLGQPNSPRGGKHVEYGYAYAKGKRIILIGKRENIFHWLSTTTIVADWKAAIETLLDWKDSIKSIEEAV